MDRNPGARPFDVRLLLQASGAALILAGLSRSTGSQAPLAAAASVGAYCVYLNRGAFSASAGALASRAAARAGLFACVLAACALGAALAVDSGISAVAFAGNAAMIGTIAIATGCTVVLAVRLGRRLLSQLGSGGRQLRDAASMARLFFVVALTAHRSEDSGQSDSRRSHL